MPSVVYYGESQTAVGVDAERYASAEPANTVASAKRMLGRSREEFEDDPYIHLAAGEGLAFATDAGAKTPVEVSAAILTALKDRAGPQLNGPISGAVITVPAYFDDAQRQATRQAAEWRAQGIAFGVSPPQRPSPMVSTSRLKSHRYWRSMTSAAALLISLCCACARACSRCLPQGAIVRWAVMISIARWPLI